MDTASIRSQASKARPFVPYVIAAIGITKRSSNWLLVSIFAAVAAQRPVSKHTLITGSHFAASDTQPGLVVG